MNEDLNQKKKKKINDTSYSTSFINFIRGKIFELKDKTIFSNENLLVNIIIIKILVNLL